MTMVVEPLSNAEPLFVSKPIFEPTFEIVSKPLSQTLSEPITFDSSLLPSSNNIILEELENHVEVIESSDSSEEVDEEIKVETRDDVSSRYIETFGLAVT